MLIYKLWSGAEAGVFSPFSALAPAKKSGSGSTTLLLILVYNINCVSSYLLVEYIIQIFLEDAFATVAGAELEDQLVATPPHVGSQLQ